MPRIKIRILATLVAVGWFLSVAQAQSPSPEAVRRALETQVPDDPAAVIAVVGKTSILAGDILPRVDSRIREITSKSPEPPSEEELKYMRAVLFRSLLAQSIQLKMLRESFLLSQVGTQSAEKRDDAEIKLQSRARQMFAETELPRLYKRYQVNTVDEIDAKLREEGSSFEFTKRDFIDQMLAHLYRMDKIPKDPPVTLSEIQNYYEDNLSKYEVKSQARWEQLSATFEASGTREKALESINEMGRDAYFGGSMQAVAKLKSQEPFASRGGLHEWTNLGSLASSKIESQVFSLPLNEMSEVIDDDDGLHIVRVLGRRPAGVKPLSELQDDIRAILKRKKIEEATKSVTKEMSRRVPVWTLYTDDIEGSIQLSLADSGSVQR